MLNKSLIRQYTIATLIFSIVLFSFSKPFEMESTLPEKSKEIIDSKNRESSQDFNDAACRSSDRDGGGKERDEVDHSTSTDQR